jgi:4-hydroxybenzoate polyprenyltransferase
VLSCLFITAGGYVINDIEDEAIDRINKPDKVIVGRLISKPAAFNAYLLLSSLGIFFGFYLTIVEEYAHIGLIELVAAGLLYFYSTSYKCIPLVGNLIVSGLSAMAVYIVIMPEPLARMNSGVMALTGIYMGFVFFTTFIRELVKDAEDIKGDSSQDCQTLAGVMGTSTTKWLAAALTAVMLGSIAYVQFISEQWQSLTPFLYVTCLIDLPLIWIIFKLMKADEEKDFRHISGWLKFLMFAGTFSLAVFYASFL